MKILTHEWEDSNYSSMTLRLWETDDPKCLEGTPILERKGIKSGDASEAITDMKREVTGPYWRISHQNGAWII